MSMPMRWGPGIEAMKETVDVGNLEKVREWLQGSIFFEKTIRSSFASLTIPSPFIREHADKIFVKGTVLRSAVSKKKWTVSALVSFPRDERQVRIHGGWKAFADFHGLAEGDKVIFSLTRKSEFDVYVFRRGDNEIQAASTQSSWGVGSEYCKLRRSKRKKTAETVLDCKIPRLQDRQQPCR